MMPSYNLARMSGMLDLSRDEKAKHFLPRWLGWGQGRLRAKDQNWADFAVATRQHGNAAEFVTVALIAVLQSLDALSETISHKIEDGVRVDTTVFKVRVVGSNRHWAQKCRPDPVCKLQHGVVLAVSEERQFGKTVVARSMCAEIHCEDAMRHGDVLYLVTTVEDEDALFVFALELVFKRHRKALDCSWIDGRAVECRVRLFQVDARDDLDMVLFHQAKQLFHETDDMALGVVRSLSQRSPQVRPFYLDLQPVVPMRQPVSICREESFLEIDDCACQVL